MTGKEYHILLGLAEQLDSLELQCRKDSEIRKKDGGINEAFYLEGKANAYHYSAEILRLKLAETNS